MTVDIDIVIRDSQDADAAALARLASPYSEQTDLQALLTASTVEARGGLSLVAEVDGAVVAHVLVAPEGPDGATLAIAVDAENRGRGIGSALMEAAIARIEARFAEIALTVESENDTARRFYESFGFEAEPVRGATLRMVRRRR